MPLDPDFVADCFYGPGAILIDEIMAIDREAGRIVARMPTPADLPITRDQRTHPTRHPAHVSGAAMIQATGIMGFAHAYYVLDLRHHDGWSGYGVRIHDARFHKLARLGPPLTLEGIATRVRRIRSQLFVRYRFDFRQDDELVFTGDQTAIWQQAT